MVGLFSLGGLSLGFGVFFHFLLKNEEFSSLSQYLWCDHYSVAEGECGE